MPSGISLIGRKFGRLKVLRETSTEDIYVCECKCGKRVKLFRSQLTKSVVRHCGCQYGKTHKKKTAETCHIRIYFGRDGKRHQRASGELLSYWAMRNRCLYKTTGDYPDYGGRGIKICARWLVRRKGFYSFLEDMGPRPIGDTLDRIDVQGHYEPDNCRWADDCLQKRNRRCILFPDGDVPPVARVPVDTLMDPEAEFAVA
jgi:hypothetical protein